MKITPSTLLLLLLLLLWVVPTTAQRLANGKILFPASCFSFYVVTVLGDSNRQNNAVGQDLTILGGTRTGISIAQCRVCVGLVEPPCDPPRNGMTSRSFWKHSLVTGCFRIFRTRRQPAIQNLFLLFDKFNILTYLSLILNVRQLANVRTYQVLVRTGKTYAFY